MSDDPLFWLFDHSSMNSLRCGCYQSWGEIRGRDAVAYIPCRAHRSAWHAIDKLLRSGLTQEQAIDSFRKSLQGGIA